jgi:hypothetical protein
MPRDLILGTAGHIDHGKTSLVKALTGIDCDRLPEEKARGITIELGFAAWQLDPSGRGDASIAFAMVSEASRLGLIVQSLKELRGDFGGAPFDEANIRDRAGLDATGYVLPLDALSNIDRVRVGQQITAYEQRVNGLESFFNYLIQIEREYGIATPALWNRLEL